MAGIGESLQISGTKEGVKFALTGDIGTGELTYKATDDDISSQAVDDEKTNVVQINKCESAVCQNFALRYLVQFSKASGLTPHVCLKMSDDIPLVVEYAIASGEGLLKFFLAPKIDDNEDLGRSTDQW